MGTWEIWVQVPTCVKLTLKMMVEVYWSCYFQKKTLNFVKEMQLHDTTRELYKRFTFQLKKWIYTVPFKSVKMFCFFQMTLTFINTCNYMYVNIFFKTIVHETTDQAIKDKESATSALKGLGVRQLATKVDNLAQSLIKDKKLKNSLWRLFLIELEEDARVLTECKLSYIPSNTTYEIWLSLTGFMC